MKKILSVVLCITMILGLSSVAFAEHYSNFTDVKPESWYYEDVDNAVRLGIINGKSETTFAPDDNLTYAEAIKLAACMYQLYKDGQVLIVSTGSPWYQTYVDYAKDHGIITDNFFDKVSDINEKATRAGYMEIFASALPDEALKGINNVPDGSIPDVPMVHESAIGIYKLYRAGILTGVDAAHNCKPEDNIKRCEVAAIITRMMNENKRVTFSMGTEVPKTEEPKTEEPKTEEPKFEIPKDAEILPEVPEEPKVEIKEETPDMYEPFEIVVQPEKIDSADEGDTLTYTVKASGGKTPYTYSWGTRDRYNGFTEFTESDYVKGAKTNTLSLVFDIDNSTTSQFCCKITDALGQEIRSEYISMPEKVFIFKPESFTKEGNGYTFAGRVEKGAVRIGETVSMHMPSQSVEVYGVVTGIIMFNKNLDEAKQGDYCGIVINEPKKIPYDLWVAENIGEALAQRLESMGNYGFKAMMHTTPCMYKSDVGEKGMVRVNVFGGKAPYTYKWYKIENSGEFTELTSNSKYKVNADTVEILVDEAEFSNRITYKCEVTDATGFSRTATGMYVIPKTTPYLAYQPSTVRANVGEEVTFYAFSRCSDATYQWYIKNDNTNGWKKIEPTDTWAKGATTSRLKIQVEMSDFRSHSEFRCDVKNGAYGIVSDSAKILPRSMYITKDPENAVGKHGEKVQFKVVAEGGKEPYKYQWEFTYPSDVLDGGYLKVYKDYEWAEGETTDTLTVLVDGTKMDSDCKFRCTVTDATGRKLTSKEAYIIITADATVDFKQGGTSKDQMIVIMP